MKKIISIAIFVFCIININISFAQTGIVTQFAGGGTGGGADSLGDGLTADHAVFAGAAGIFMDSVGNLFVSDSGHARIRKVVGSSNIITCVAGTGIHGFSGDGGLAVLGNLQNNLRGVVSDHNGNIYITDAGNQRIRKIDNSTGIITTIAGNGTSAYSIDGSLADTSALLSLNGIYVDRTGNVFLTQGNKISKIDAATNRINTVAGTGVAGFSGDGGPGTLAMLNSPFAITGDRHGNIYFTDSKNNIIRKVDSFGVITSIAGKTNSLTETWFDYFPGDLYYSGDGGAATAAQLVTPTGITIDTAGNLLLIDAAGSIIRKINLSTGIITKVAGSDVAGITFHNGIHADSLRLNAASLTIDAAGNLYYSNSDNTIRKITGAASALKSASATDSLQSASCTIPDTIGYGVYGVITGVPATSDSVHISVNFGDGSTSVSYTLPYQMVISTLGDTSYCFGTPFNNMGTHFCNLPGTYTPRFSITTTGGAMSEVSAPTIRVGSICDTFITGITIDNFTDSIITLPCVCPYTRFKINGRITGTPATSDSLYLIAQFGDDSTLKKVLTFTYSSIDSTYRFADTFGHAYTTAGDFYPRALVVSNSGAKCDIHTAPDIYNEGCGCGSGTGSAGSVDLNFTDDANGGIECTLPYTNHYHISGRLHWMATTASAVTNVINFGTGLDTIVSIPVVTDGHGRYTFKNDSIIHTYMMAGAYSTSDLSIAAGFSNGHSTPTATYGGSCSGITGVFYIDANGNCLPDTGERKLGYWNYKIVNQTLGVTNYGWTDDSGHYSFSLIDSNTYQIIANPLGSFYGMGDSLTPTCPASGIDTLMPLTGTSYSKNFAFGCTPPSTLDMFVSGWGWGFIPSDTGVISVWSGDTWGYICDSLHSTISLTLDTKLTYAGMWNGPAPDSILGQTLKWNFSTNDNLFEFNGDVKVLCSPTAMLGDSVHNILHVNASSLTDPDTTNNTYSWYEPIQAAWDPNGKQVSPKGFGTQGFIDNGKDLSYNIHFQNTGTAPVVNAFILDTLDANLQIGSLQLLTTSSPVQISQIAPNVLKFQFNNINLPDSATDKFNSIGYISYNITPLPNLAPHTQLINKATVYFSPYSGTATNTTLNTIKDTLYNIYGPSIICTGTPGTLLDSSTGGTWSRSNGNATVSSTGVVTGLTAGTDTITYTIVYPWGIFSKTQVITVANSPLPGTITGADSVVCTGSQITFNDTVAGGSWSCINSSASINSSGIVTGVIGGIDTVIYTITVGFCSSSAIKSISVNTTPLVIPPLNQSACSGQTTIGTAFTGNVSGEIYNWVNSNPSIGLPATGSSDIGPFTAFNSSSVAVVATITVTPKANGCVGPTATFSYTVDPVPAAPSITTMSNDTMCTFAKYQNFGTSTFVSGINYQWSADLAEIWATGVNHQYCLVNFNTPSSTATITLSSNYAGFNCPIKTNYYVYVLAEDVDSPAVIYLNNMFWCLTNSETSFQWGYDQKDTLNPLLIPGEINQTYYNASPDTVNGYYWVKTVYNGCTQKTYFNSPLNISQNKGRANSDLLIYPNPASGSFTVKIPLGGNYEKGEIMLFDVLGKEISKFSFTENMPDKVTFDVSLLPCGSYYVKTVTKGNTYFGKVEIITGR